jgi:biopolymer transport protein ExbD
MITEINVTPLVDIILVLLIIFMLTAHLIARQAIEVALPKATQGAAPQPALLAVTLARDGRVYLDGAEVGAAALHDAVRAAVARDARTQVLVAADKDVAHGRVVWVLDLVKSLNVTSFAIQIDPAGITPPERSE